MTNEHQDHFVYPQLVGPNAYQADYINSIQMLMPWLHVSSAGITSITGLIPGLRPANEKRRYEVTPSLIGWAQT